jgi:hypothetical protein
LQHPGAAVDRLRLRKVPAVLRGLARGLERSSRQSLRRTRHAQRHSRQVRPVHKALDDVRVAGPNAFFYDEKRETWIVCGKQGRTHAFNSNGRLVTSFSLPPGGAERRVGTARWRRLEGVEVEPLRQKILRDEAHLQENG